MKKYIVALMRKSHLTPLFQKYRDKFNSLGTREKNVVMGGAIVIGLLLFYACIWSPLISHTDTLREQIQHERKAALKIEETLKHIRTLGKESTLRPATLDMVRASMQTAGLSEHLTQLTLTKTQQILCVFDHVDFDELIAWLIANSSQFIIQQARIDRVNNVGTVRAVLVM